MLLRIKASLLIFFFLWKDWKITSGICTHMCTHIHKRTHAHTHTSPSLAGIALQHRTGISTYNPTHRGLHNPYTQPWPDMQRNFMPNMWVGKSILSFLQKDIQAIITQLSDDPCLPVSGSSQRLPCLLFISAVGFKLAQWWSTWKLYCPLRESMKFWNILFPLSYEPGTIFPLKKAVYECHIKPQPKCMCSTKQCQDRQWTNWLYEFFC